MDLETVSFSGHESFVFRNTWLTKGSQRFYENSNVFHSKDGMAVLGVGKNMVNSIRHWCIATGLLEEYFESVGRCIKKIVLQILGRIYL